MSKSQPPNPQPPSFEVPDLELQPTPRSGRQTARAPANSGAPKPLTPPGSAHAQRPDPSLQFGAGLDDFEFERSARPDFQMATESRVAKSAPLEVDAGRVASLANYGEPPDNGARALVYAYRVFSRQRELQRELVAVDAESARVEHERRDTLFDLARALRPALEQKPEFRLAFAAVDDGNAPPARLVELSRALLAAPDALAIPGEWLERVRSVDERADQLLVRRELLSRALDSYDARGAQRGVNLACTGVGLLLVLFAFKLIF